MMWKPWIAGGAALLASLLLAACGGGATFGGGISGTGKPGIKVGDVATSGGLRVQGTTFATGTTVVTIDGVSASAAELEDGHVAFVEGRIDGASGVAEIIHVDSVVAGALEAKLDPNRVRVLGQEVQIDARTIFAPGIVPASVDGLVVGDLLKVYGFVKAPGQVVATRIERSASLSELRLVGMAENVDEGRSTCTIGQQAVDYAAADVSDLPGGNPSNRQLIRVRGSAALGSLGEVIATRVDSVNLDDHSDNDETEIEGFVTAVVSADEFRIGDVTVRTDGTTLFLRGLPADVVVGARVDIEGALNGGAVDAREVGFDSSVELESDVATVVGNTITLVGLPGITVAVDSLTTYDGDADTLGDLEPGDHVEIRGRASSSSSVAAVQVKKTGADTDVILQGPVDPSPATQDPLLSILGETIDTSGIAPGEFESPDGGNVGRAAFFAALAPGVVVKLEGRLVGSAVDWEKAELEGEED